MNIKLADRLVELRKEHKLSQEALAEKLGLSRQSISKWERAEASPDTDNLIALAEVYGITLDQLLGNDEPKVEPQPQPKPQPQSVKKELSENQIKGKQNLKKVPLLFLGAIAVYVGLGILLSVVPVINAMWWGGMWTLFLVVFGYAFVSASMMYEDRKILSIIFSAIGTTLYATTFFVLTGIFLGLWGISWIVFLAIPAYVYIKVIKK